MMLIEATLIATLMFLDSDGAVFPGSETETPPDCIGQLCSTKPENYDELEKSFDDILSKMDGTIDLNSMQNKYSDYEYYSSVKTGNCEMITRSFVPYTLEYNKTYPVIQMAKFPQHIKTVECKSIGQRCFEDFNLESECKPKYATTILFIYDKDQPPNEALTPEEVNIPVDCYCDISI